MGKETSQETRKVQASYCSTEKEVNPSDKEVEDIVARVLSNQDEVKRMSEQLTSQKLLNFYKENANLKVKKLTYDAFVKEVYGK